MLKKILIGVAVVIVLLLVFIAMQPGDLRVERSTVINAPPAAVFPLINDMRKFNEWNPWAKVDPSAKYEFTGSPSGPGQVFDWQGNSEVGKGRMTILESKPDELVRIDLEFFEPFAGKNITELRLQPEGAGTKVTWAMYGPKSFMSKAMGLVMDMDVMIGGMYEKGLAEMKRIAEAPATATATPSTPHEAVTVPPEFPGEQPSTSVPKDLPPPTDTGGEQPRVE